MDITMCALATHGLGPRLHYQFNTKKVVSVRKVSAEPIKYTKHHRDQEEVSDTNHLGLCAVCFILVRVCAIFHLLCLEIFVTVIF